MAAQTPRVGIVMGSDSDWDKIQTASATLTQFGVAHEVRVLSAHRTPRAAEEYATTARRRGLQALICAAGGAAHLAGVMAAHTTLPVIGIPVAGGALNGMDALLATVQMPGGVPVATVAVGSAGPVNAAILAVQVLALADPSLVKALERHRESLTREVEAGNARIQQKLVGGAHA